MHIAIEGMDGVGKTTTAKLLASMLNFRFIEKPLHLLLDDEKTCDNYLKLSSYINNQNHIELKALFYGLGNVYLSNQYRDIDIITDRHLVSNYFWNSSDDNYELFDYLIKVCGKPDITILLYADMSVRENRIKSRNDTDCDLSEINKFPDAYEKMRYFLERFNFEYYEIDNSKLSIEETVDKIACILTKKQLLINTIE